MANRLFGCFNERSTRSDITLPDNERYANYTHVQNDDVARLVRMLEDRRDAYDDTTQREGTIVPAFDGKGTSEVRATSALICRLYYDRLIHISILPISDVRRRWALMASELSINGVTHAPSDLVALINATETELPLTFATQSDNADSTSTPKAICEQKQIDETSWNIHEARKSESPSETAFGSNCIRNIVFVPIITGLQTMKPATLQSINITQDMFAVATTATLWGGSANLTINPPFVKLGAAGSYQRQFQMTKASFMDKVEKYRINNQYCNVNDKAVARRLNESRGEHPKSPGRRMADSIIDRERDDFALYWFEKLFRDKTLVEDEDVVVLATAVGEIYRANNEDATVDVAVFRWDYEFETSGYNKDPLPVSLRLMVKFKNMPFCVVDNFSLGKATVRASIVRRLRRDGTNAPYFEVDTNRSDVFCSIRRVNITSTSGLHDKRIISLMERRPTWLEAVLTEDEEVGLAAYVKSALLSQKLLCPTPVMLAFVSTLGYDGENWKTKIADELETAVAKSDHSGYTIGRLAEISITNRRRSAVSAKRAIIYYSLRGGTNSYLNLWL